MTSKRACRAISLLFAALLLFTQIPILPASAASGAFSYTIAADGTAKIDGYEGTGPEVVIPEKIDGYTVSYVDCFAFVERADITSIHFPRSVKGIASYGLHVCASLREITVDGSNTVWPVTSWSSIDWCGRWKALHYHAKRFFAPLMIFCQEEGMLTQNRRVRFD